MPQHTDPSIRIRFQEEMKQGARIKVVGVGGGGVNAVNRMIESGMEGVEFISINTDLQSLETSKAQTRLQLGTRLTRGLGTGANAEIGRQAALEGSEEIIEALEDADMVFVTAGLGGGTGTGAAPVIASLAIVTRPFGFEGKRRMKQAERGVQDLLDHADTLIVIPNDKLLAAARNAGFFESFLIADDVLRQAVQGISDIVTDNGVINCDFADVRTTMAGMGYAVMGSATRTGPNRAAEAASAAIASPLLEAGAIDGARGILINISGSSSLKLSEVSVASTVIQSAAHENANIIFGAILDERLGAEVKVTIIAAGFHEDSRDRAERRLQGLNQLQETRAAYEAASQPRAFAATGIRSDSLIELEAETQVPAEAAAETAMHGLPEMSAAVEAREQVPVEDLAAEEKEFEQDYSEPAERYFEADEWFEEDLLAKIEGPVFDFDVVAEEHEVMPPKQVPAQPEIARLRQTAMAAYVASSMIEDEDEQPAAPGEASFAEVLANREKVLDLVAEDAEAQEEENVPNKNGDLDLPAFLRRRT